MTTTKDLKKEMFFPENRETTKSEIHRLSNDLLAEDWVIGIYRNRVATELNLKDLGWKFEFNNRKTAAGLCSFTKKTIYISEWLLNQNLNKSLEFENTIRHEIAHAIDFEMRGTSDHGRIWKAIAREVLCTAERCFTKKQIGITEQTKYTLKCTEIGCNFEIRRHKRSTSMKRIPCCTDCFNGGKGYKILAQIQNY